MRLAGWEETQGRLDINSDAHLHVLGEQRREDFKLHGSLRSFAGSVEKGCHTVIHTETRGWRVFSLNGAFSWGDGYNIVFGTPGGERKLVAVLLVFPPRAAYHHLGGSFFRIAIGLFFRPRSIEVTHHKALGDAENAAEHRYLNLTFVHGRLDFPAVRDVHSHRGVVVRAATTGYGGRGARSTPVFSCSLSRRLHHLQRVTRHLFILQMNPAAQILRIGGRGGHSGAHISQSSQPHTGPRT